MGTRLQLPVPYFQVHPFWVKVLRGCPLYPPPSFFFSRPEGMLFPITVVTKGDITTGTKVCTRLSTDPVIRTCSGTPVLSSHP